MMIVMMLTLMLIMTIVMMLVMLMLLIMVIVVMLIMLMMLVTHKHAPAYSPSRRTSASLCSEARETITPPAGSARAHHDHVK